MIFPPAHYWRICTYRCGECSYLRTDWWVEHQGHYLEHRLGDMLYAMKEEELNAQG
jgi:hypothetical protein